MFGTEQTLWPCFRREKAPRGVGQDNTLIINSLHEFADSFADKFYFAKINCGQFCKLDFFVFNRFIHTFGDENKLNDKAHESKSINNGSLYDNLRQYYGKRCYSVRGAN